jgi:hypothetical protein
MTAISTSFYAQISEQHINKIFSIRDHLREIVSQVHHMNFINENLTNTMFNNMIREMTLICLLCQSDEYEKIPDELSELIQKLKHKKECITVISGNDGCILSDLIQIEIDELQSLYSLLVNPIILTIE